MNIKTSLDLLYLGGSIALIGLALYLTHAAERHDDEHEKCAPHDHESH